LRLRSATEQGEQQDRAQVVQYRHANLP
jgi:hypothetical protein